MVSCNGECYYQAELTRLKGELLFTQSVNRDVSRASTSRQCAVKAEPPSTFADAEHCFLQSIQIAQRQTANSLELRAVMSLARLYQRQSKQQEAKSLLAQIYGKFTEGFRHSGLA